MTRLNRKHFSLGEDEVIEVLAQTLSWDNLTEEETHIERLIEQLEKLYKHFQEVGQLGLADNVEQAGSCPLTHQPFGSWELRNILDVLGVFGWDDSRQLREKFLDSQTTLLDTVREISLHSQLVAQLLYEAIHTLQSMKKRVGEETPPYLANNPHNPQMVV